MAGHSKWANIKHRKGRADALKGKLFSRLTKEIISSVKQGGADPKNNPRLRIAIQKAKEGNLPNENIERNIKKASSADQSDFLAMTYELYGHGGVAILVEVMTDNKNRTASDMRIATNKRGGTLASPGAVAYNFDRKGIITLDPLPLPEDELFLLASDAGAEDCEFDEGMCVITTSADALTSVKEGLEAHGLKPASAELQMLPKNLVHCDAGSAEANRQLIEWLEALDDVDAVYHNQED